MVKRIGLSWDAAIRAPVKRYGALCTTVHQNKSPVLITRRIGKQHETQCTRKKPSTAKVWVCVTVTLKPDPGRWPTTQPMPR